MRGREEGFTLIELLVVILVIGILLAIALPAFLGQQGKARDSEAKSQLSSAYKEAKAVATAHEGNFVTGSFTAAELADAIEAGEPHLGNIQVAASPAAPTEGIMYLDSDATTNDDVRFLWKSNGGKTWTLTVVNRGGPQFASD